MKNVSLLFLVLLFSATQIFAQISPDPSPAEIAILKADLLLSQKGRTDEALEAYQRSLALAEKRSQEVEIGRGFHACAVNFHREAVQLEKEGEADLAKLRHQMAWQAFKDGESQLKTEKISPYVIYTMSLSAVHGGKHLVAIPYLESIKDYETEHSSIYHYLYLAYLKDNKEAAHKVLNEGVKRFPSNGPLKKDAELVFGNVSNSSNNKK